MSATLPLRPSPPMLPVAVSAPAGSDANEMSDAYVVSGFSRTVTERPGPAEGRWLVKPVASGGGHGVRMWRRGARVPRGSYLQQFVDGTPASVVFIAAARGAVPIGVSRQLVGEAAFGSAGYRYCGSILAAAGDPQFAHDAALFDAACALARAASEDFDLVGANGIDFIAHNGVAVADRGEPALDRVDGAGGARLRPLGVRRPRCRLCLRCAARLRPRARGDAARAPAARRWSSPGTTSCLAIRAPGSRM